MGEVRNICRFCSEHLKSSSCPVKMLRTRSSTKIMRQFCKLGTDSGKGKMDRWYETLKYALTM
jgi:hypothetical protein